MSNPRIKRPFAGAASDPSQRQITSFFNPSTSAGDLSSEPLRQPALPSSVQTNLLSVGMRIRKSVPEGYKTAGHSAFKLWTDNSTPSSATTRSTPSKSVGRELLPFCGINNVGGFDTQPSWTRLDDDEDDVPGLDAVPELSLSQESTDSTASDTTRKRFFEDDEASDPVRAWAGPNGWDGEVSPRSLTPSGGWGNGSSARAMAVPRSRVKKGTPLKQVDQENMSVDKEGDFEEADFFVYGGDEMETSG